MTFHIMLPFDPIGKEGDNIYTLPQPYTCPICKNVYRPMACSITYLGAAAMREKGGAEHLFTSWRLLAVVERKQTPRENLVSG